MKIYYLFIFRHATLYQSKKYQGVIVQDIKTKRWDQQATIIEKVRQKAYTVNIDGTRHLRNRRFIRPNVIGDPETLFQNLAPQRQCQQTRHGRPGHGMVPEQQRNRDGGVAFPREVWPHLSDWQPERQLMLKQNKSPHAFLSCKSEFDREGADQKTKRTKMTATVTIIPHAPHGGQALDAEIWVDTGCALSLVSTDWAPRFGGVENPDPKPIIRQADNKVLECTGRVSFKAEYGGNSTVVTA